MMRESILIAIENDGPASDGQFLHRLKLGLLMALQEQGLLNERQLRLALESLGGGA